MLVFSEDNPSPLGKNIIYSQVSTPSLVPHVRYLTKICHVLNNDNIINVLKIFNRLFEYHLNGFKSLPIPKFLHCWVE